ncbi:DUF3649 domain-containing protein [Pseudomonas aeruginosa]|nr:DUF3649 domain-containing protein [Pseudomonas aeruginosa]
MARRTNATGYDPLSSDPGNPRRAATWRSSGASTNANVIEIQSQTFRIDDRLATRERGVAVPARRGSDDARPCFHPGRRPMTSQALADGLSVTGRILVAVLLGYALAYAVTACLSIYLPLPRPDRVSFGSLGCFAVWVAAIVYAFAARSAWRACWVLALASLALGGLAWLGLDYGARP